jgi:serine/threonine protein phosphatase 1
MKKEATSFRRGSSLAKDHRHTYNCIWGRSKFYQNSHSIVDNITEIYVGHSVVDNVLRLGNTTFIDTGAVFNTDKLTIIKL